MRLFARTTLLLFRTHLSRVFLSRRGLVCAILALLPAAVAATIAQLTDRIDAVEILVHLGALLLLQLVVPILALVAGSAVVAEEIEDRTITYLFSRPVPRAALLFGRWLATVVFLTTLLLLATTLLVLAASSSDAPEPVIDAAVARPLYEAVLLGGVSYSALFAVLGIFFRHPILVGLGYAFAIEGFLANLPGANQSLTIQYYLKSWLIGRGGSPWQISEFSPAQPGSLSSTLSTLAIVVAVALLFGAWRIARREFVLTS